MNEIIRIQGRDLSSNDIAYIKEQIATHPQWHRTRLSREICAAWAWRDEVGRPKDMACRTMLLKLERKGFLKLPPPRRPGVNQSRGKSFQPVLHDSSALECPLRTLQPITLITPERGQEAELWQTLLTQYHYLGFKTHVGQSISYLAQTNDGRPVACLLFAAAAWKTAPRDSFIGWSAKVRERNISRVINNTRFLIPPWVKVPHLASHILAMARCRKDAKLCFVAKDPAHPRKRYADDKFTPESVLKDKTIPYKSGQFFIGGKYRKIRYKEVCNLLWQGGAGEKRLRLIVLAPIPYHLSPNSRANYRDPVYLLSDANDITITKLIQAYVDRWKMEVNHRDEKQQLGIGDAQVWNDASVDRFPAFIVASYSFLLMASLQAYGAKRTDEYIHPPKWQRRRARPSCQDLLALIRKEAFENPELLKSLDLSFEPAEACLKVAA